MPKKIDPYVTTVPIMNLRNFLSFAITQDSSEIDGQIVFLFEVNEELNKSSMITLNFDGQPPS